MKWPVFCFAGMICLIIGAARADETKANALADSVGKALPDWTVTDAQNVKKDVKLADFKGKWVLLEFWGFG